MIVSPCGFIASGGPGWGCRGWCGVGEYDVVKMPVEALSTVEVCSFGLRHTFLPTTAPSGRRDLLLRPMIVGDEFNLSNIWGQLTSSSTRWQGATKVKRRG